jgi:hypothetical protein
VFLSREKSDASKSDQLQWPSHLESLAEAQNGNGLSKVFVSSYSAQLFQYGFVAMNLSLASRRSL